VRAGERIRRLAWATGAMMIGTVLVLGTVILINRYSNSLDETRSEATSQIALERKKPPPDQEIQKPKPKPPPPRPLRWSAWTPRCPASTWGCPVSRPMTSAGWRATCWAAPTAWS
jgi:hypothetical protein